MGKQDHTKKGTIMSFHRSILSTAIAVASFTTTNLHAQTADGAIEEITITARKRDEAYVDAPVTVTVFTEDEVEAAGIETPADFIALTPNVTLVQVQNAGNSFVTARGISQNRNTEMSVAVLMDGVLMVNPAQFNQELFDIQQIEVLKGPQGALYGRNAIGGAITVTTREPSDFTEGAIRVGYDSGEGYRAQGYISGPLNEDGTLKYRASLSRKDVKGYLDNPYLGEKADPYEDTSARLRFIWDPSDTFRADLRFYVSQLDTQALYYNIRESAPAPFPGAPAAFGRDNGYPNSVNDTSLPIRVNNPGVNERDLSNVSLKLDWDFANGTLTSITSYDTLEELLTGDAWDFLPTDEAVVPTFFGFPDQNQSQYLDVEAVSQEIRWTSPSENRLRWIAGAYMVQTDRFISTGNMVDTGQGVFPVYRQPRGNFPFDFATDFINPQITYLADSQDNFAWAVFGELAYDLTDNTEVALSVRYDDDERENTTLTPTAFLPNVPGFPQGFTGEVRTKSWDEWQPKFTIRHKPNDLLSVYGTVSRGFRSGGFNQTGVGGVAFANGFLGVGDTFDAEVVDTWEAGVKGQSADGRVRANLSMFTSQAEGTYFFIFLAANSTQNLGNFGKVDYSGFELDVVANLTDYVSMNFGYGHVNSEIKESLTARDIGDRAPNVSKYTMNAGLDFRTPAPSIGTGVEAFLRLDYQIIGDTAFFDNNQADTNDRDPVHLLDFRAGVELPDDWTVTLWGKNALDEEYNTEYSTGGFVFKALPARYGLDFTKRF
ncbi:MAG: TonB-dependent receptor [Pseudohongiellaceae bacterium]